jgi:hypothetical protein
MMHDFYHFVLLLTLFPAMCVSSNLIVHATLFTAYRG